MSRSRKTAEDVAAVATEVVAAAVPGTEIAPPAAETMQSGQDGAGEADSGDPAVVDPASPTSGPAFTDGAPLADLAPADPAAAIAAQLVTGEPNADLVEAVRQVLERGGYGASLSLSSSTADWRLGFPVLMHLDRDKVVLEPGQIAFVTEDEFDQLQRAHVFSRDLDWEDGLLPEETGDGEG